MSEVKSDVRWVRGEALPDILTVGDPKLKQRAKPVGDIKHVRSLCERMVNRLRELNGAGLAAPQIGEPLRIIVVEVRKTDIFPDRPESLLYVMINPWIIETSNDKEDGWEGCFSVPGLMGVVPRHKTIRVQYVTPDGVEHDETFEGYLARVMQHEYDHLDGIEFLDRMESMESISTVENWKRFNPPVAQI